MDRVFLDANVLFSAPYRENSGLLRLWEISETEIVTSLYAWNEAQRNTQSDEQLVRLNRLRLSVEIPIWVQDDLPAGVSIIEKDLPILLDAINSRSTHLLTGDKQHFGHLYGQRVRGVLILAPADYLALRSVLDSGDDGGAPSS